MNGDGGDFGDPGAPMHMAPRSQMRKGESKVGNILELILTYGSGLCLFTPYLCVVLFGNWGFKSDPVKEAAFGWSYMFVLWLYFVVNGYAAVVNTESRFTKKTFRFFMDIFASLSPIILTIVLGALIVVGKYIPTQVDIKIMFFACAFAGLDLLLHSNLVQTAVRRVHEGAYDR